MAGARAWRRWLRFIPFACGVLLVPLLLLACGARTPATPTVVGALAKAAPFTRGEPALVFVYTDG